MSPRGSNCHATAPEPASAPPDFVNIERTSAAVRFRLLGWASAGPPPPPGPGARPAPGAVALVDDLLEVGRLAAAGRLVDGPLDVVRGHVHRARFLDGE